jgi:hypothetical protein
MRDTGQLEPSAPLYLFIHQDKHDAMRLNLGQNPSCRDELAGDYGSMALMCARNSTCHPAMFQAATPSGRRVGVLF